MPSPAPIKLGSAAGSTLVFETGSTVRTSQSGIQACEIRALCPDAANVFGFIPAAGASFNTVFGNSYLPSTFLYDASENGGATIEYLEGNLARITFSFKRPDPLLQGRANAKIYVDSVINYKTWANNLYSAVVYTTAGGDTAMDKFGFPEPVVTVKYNTTTPRSIGGDISTLYAQPGSANAQGFPTINSIAVPYSVPVAKGTAGIYFDNTNWVAFSAVNVFTTFNFQLNFITNPNGWQLNRLKWDPVAGVSFYDVEEEWRNYFIFAGPQFLNTVPHL